MPTYAGSGAHMMKMMLGPDEFFAANVTMASLIQEAFGVQGNQITGGPDWLSTDRFDVQGKVNTLDAPGLGLGPNRPATQHMLQAALAQYTQLAVHTETKDLPTYALVVAEAGSKLQPAQGPDSAVGARGMVGMRRMTMQKGSGGQVVGLAAQGVPVADFASQLSRQVGTAIIDKTGLKGNYNFDLQWAAQGTPNAPDNPGPASADSAQTISTALEQQLGLKLIPQTQPMPVVVIDHIEKPASN